MAELKNVIKQIEFHQNFVGEGFITSPENNFSRVNVFGEINKLYDFIPNSVYLTYEFDLPIGWKIDDENEYYEIYKKEHYIEENINKIRTISQKSTSGNHSNTHNLNLPFELELLAHNKVLDKSFPSLLIQVNSIDDWGRHRIEGYSFLQIPNKSSFTKLKIPCYKPIEDLAMKIFSFYLGGSRRIPDLKEISKKYSLNENEVPVALNKYGIKTEFSGFVEVSINVTIQRKEVADLYKKIIKEKQGKIAYSISTALDSDKSDNFKATINKQDKTTIFEMIRTNNHGEIGRFTSN